MLRTFYIAILLFCCAGCSFFGNNDKPAPPLFKTLDASATGLQFANTLTPTTDFNMFKYMYFYNGAGLGAGDFNNDGKTDLFFAGNQVPSALYLNKGGLTFEDITPQSGIKYDSGWSTGVSVVDINNDGLLDIYVCRVGNFEPLKGHNLLLTCTSIDAKGIPHYVDSAQAYGLDFSGFSTQAAFFDADLDGDLDMYLLNHAVHHSGMFAERSQFLGTFSSLSGDKFYRNNKDVFKDETRTCGINSSAIGYGLGIVVADINLDGYPDLYIGNDFHENDYLYINQRNGTFKDELSDRIMHTSQFTMGVDVADINNDAQPEIISMDMLPKDPYILKRSLGEDAHDIFKMKIRYGYHHQYARNNLQLNRGNGFFSEVGLYSGIYATDWSWAALWMDFDNDGLKDLFVANGIPKRLNDMDYVQFISNKEYQNKIRTKTMTNKDMALVDKFPEIKLPNQFFVNKGNAIFQEENNRVMNSPNTYSNGSIYADLDNDGDLDIVVNNIADKALVYENTAKSDSTSQSIQVHLKGAPDNRNAIGAKLVLFSGSELLTAEKQPIRGFLSSMEIPLQIGIGAHAIDSAWLIWPDGGYQPLSITQKVRQYQAVWQKGLPTARWDRLQAAPKVATLPINEISASVGLQFVHRENSFNEFDREPLLPYMLSTEGPALAVADINHDGLTDIFVGAARNAISKVWLQDKKGKFVSIPQPALAEDSSFEDIDAVWADMNNDGHTDLLVASGGNEFYGTDNHLQPRLYLNDGKGNLTKKENAFADINCTIGCIAVYDFNQDGLLDVFAGGRAVPFQYGISPRSYLLQNDGKGHFVDVTSSLAPELTLAGLITSAIWHDVNTDGQQDLVLTAHWDGVMAFVKKGDKYIKTYLTNASGWWNKVLPVDYNMDGKIDLVLGNLGTNSRLQASEKQPVNMYVGDLDGNGNPEQLLTYYLQGKEIPFANKDELQKQMPSLKKKYLYAEDFAKAQLKDIFDPTRLKNALLLTATRLDNAVLLNQGNMKFTLQTLPWQTQLSPCKDAIMVEANGDSLPDILLVGNFYENNIQMGRYDADMGTILINRGGGKYEVGLMQPHPERGEIRKVRRIVVNKVPMLLMGKNNDSLRLYRGWR